MKKLSVKHKKFFLALLKLFNDNKAHLINNSVVFYDKSGNVAARFDLKYVVDDVLVIPRLPEKESGFAIYYDGAVFVDEYNN